MQLAYGRLRRSPRLVRGTVDVELSPIPARRRPTTRTRATWPRSPNSSSPRWPRITGELRP